MIPTLDIQLLGSFLLRADGTAVTALDSPRLQALLAYLLLHRNAPLPRQHLAFQLWPDSTEAQAHSNLRTLLVRLRRALPEADHFLDADPYTLQWRLDAPFTLDVAEFERAVGQAEQTGNETTTRVALQEAIELYHGDLLPAGYDEWLLPERERLRQSFITALEQLIHLLEDQHDYRAAIQAAQRLLRHDPLHEATYQRLMRLHALSGDRASALRIYHTCVTVLARELGVEPSTATRAAYDILLHPEPPAGPPISRPPSSPGVRRHNLPIPLTSFIGRAYELAEVKQLLHTTRLLTLTGAGGCGKSRLALAVATEVVTVYPDGVWLVELAALANPTLVPQAVATALGLREEEQRPLVTTLTDALRPQAMLLVLDNCEHLIDACAHLTQTLLSACPQLQILATSREALGLTGETVWPVPSLSLPKPQPMFSIEELTQSEAIQLFLERAVYALPTFVLTRENALAVVQVCRRLDGIPLAIELAAARVKLLSVTQLAARLDDSLRLLTGGSRTKLPRHQTLRAAIDWSYDLLSEVERVLFRQLAAFAGGWTLEAMEAICGGRETGKQGSRGDYQQPNTSTTPPPHPPAPLLDLLAHLVDKSLVVVEMQPGDEARYRLLETIRQYAWDKLSSSGEEESVRGRHLDFFLSLAEEAAQKSRGAEQAAGLDRLETEHDNLRASLEWSRESGQVVAGLQLASALWYFWVARGPYSEGRERLLEVLSRPGAAERTAARANALNAAGAMQALKGNYLEARLLFEEALAIGRELVGKPIIAAALRHLGTIAYAQGDYVAARSLHEEGLALWRELGSKSDISWSLCFLGDVVMGQGDDQQAQMLYEESVTLLREVKGNILLAYALRRLGQIALRQGNYEEATALCRESLTLNWEAEDMRGVAASLVGLAGVAAARGQTVYEYPRHAAQLLGAAEALLDAIDSPLIFGDRIPYDRNVVATRAQLDEVTFAAAWAEGRAMPLEQAIAEALRVAEG